MATIEMKAVKELCDCNFFIPSYQRGYRWKEEQVLQLLDDINEFRPTDAAPFYFLQALAIAKQDDDKYNVVDGQQRLTTIELILQQVGHELPVGWLSFERNPQGQTSLGALDKHYRNEASKVIMNWLKEHPAERNTIREKLLDAKFLFYEIKSSETEMETFSRLNSGKIRARDSELIKAIMLTPLLDEPFSVTQARAQEWDTIERSLNNDLFFSFFTAKNTWKEDDRMAVLLNWAGLIPDEEEKESAVFPYLACLQKKLQKGMSRADIWCQVYSAYYRLAAWFDDAIMYHAVGWLVHKKNKTILSVHNLQETLHNEINKKQNFSTDEIDFEAKDIAYHFLLLFNVAYCWRRWPIRYDFYRHRNTRWELEHIFARNQDDFFDKEKLCQYLQTNLNDDKFKEYREECEQKKGDEWLDSWLKEKYDDDGYPTNEDHSLGNLALLGGAENKSLSNRVFEGKRVKIIEWATEKITHWVPPATEAVFLKALPGLDMTRKYWTIRDREVYVEHMKKEIKAFVTALNSENS